MAPTAPLMKAMGAFLLGSFILFVGAGLSFKLVIRPALLGANNVANQLVGRIAQPSDVDVAMHFLGGACLLVGAVLLFNGARGAIVHIIETLNPGVKLGKVDIYFRKQQLAQGPRIVAIGGGTGLSTLLRGLKHYTSNIAAIVTVTDDGGSSGQLIKDKQMIPPGDIRNCLVALADAEKSMTDLFQHRFKNDSGSLSGHSMGNLLIAALVDQAHGDFEKAVETASDVLAIRGRVIPSTLTHARLKGIMDDGTEVIGETAIVEDARRIQRVLLDPPDAVATQEAIEAIRSADLVCIGPGSVYTSIIPNLLVPGIADALRQSKARRVYICNVMTQPGESDSFSASQHVASILANSGQKVFDTVFVNDGIPSEEARQKYAGSGQQLVEADADRIRAMGIRVITGNFMSETDVVRHDPMKVVARLMSLLQ